MQTVLMYLGASAGMYQGACHYKSLKLTWLKLPGWSLAISNPLGVKYQLESAVIANHYFSVTLARTHNQLLYVCHIALSVALTVKLYIHSTGLILSPAIHLLFIQLLNEWAANFWVSFSLFQLFWVPYFWGSYIPCEGKQGIGEAALTLHNQCCKTTFIEQAKNLFNLWAHGLNVRWLWHVQSQ